MRYMKEKVGTWEAWGTLGAWRAGGPWGACGVNRIACRVNRGVEDGFREDGFWWGWDGMRGAWSVGCRCVGRMRCGEDGLLGGWCVGVSVQCRGDGFFLRTHSR